MIVAAFQWSALAPYMTELNLAPLIGGLVISRRVRLQVSGEYHDALGASMVRIGRAFNAARRLG